MAKLRTIAGENEFAEIMLQEFSKKSQVMMKSDALGAAIYMDPRFNFPRSKIVPVESQSRIKVI